MHLIIIKRPMGQHRSFNSHFSQSILSRLAGISSLQRCPYLYTASGKSGEDSCAGVVPRWNTEVHISFLF